MKNIRSGACCDDTAWDLAELFCVAACTNNQRYCCLLVVYVLFVYGLSSLHCVKKKKLRYDDRSQERAVPTWVREIHE